MSAIDFYHIVFASWNVFWAKAKYKEVLSNFNIDNLQFIYFKRLNHKSFKSNFLSFEQVKSREVKAHVVFCRDFIGAN